MKNYTDNFKFSIELEYCSCIFALNFSFSSIILYNCNNINEFNKGIHFAVQDAHISNNKFNSGKLNDFDINLYNINDQQLKNDIKNIKPRYNIISFTLSLILINFFLFELIYMLIYNILLLLLL